MFWKSFKFQIMFIMGICQERNQHKGCYAMGCPPNNDKMRAAISEACGLD